VAGSGRSGGPRITTDRTTGRTVITDRGRAPVTTAPGTGMGTGTGTDRGTVSRPSRDLNAVDPRSAQPRGGVTAQPRVGDAWRGQTLRPGTSQGTISDRAIARPDVHRPPTGAGREVAPSDGWRGRAPSRADAGPDRRGAQAPPYSRSQDSWRRPESVPPARRVIEGAVPNRRAPQGYTAPDIRGRERTYPSSPSRSEPRYDTRREYVPREAAPRSMDRAPRSEPAPRYEAPRSYAPAPRSMERAPAPAPRSAPAPAPRSAPPPSAPRSGHTRGR